MGRIKERERVERSARRRRLILALIAAAAIACSAGFLCFNYLVSQQGAGPEVQVGEVRPRALVADSLMLDFPDPELIDYLVSTLRSAGYDVDVVYGSDVNLTLYSRLTEYSLIILRVHGGKAVYKTPDGAIHKLNGLFTGVSWSDEYSGLKAEWIATRAFPYNSSKAFLAVLPKFFDVNLKGEFRPGSVMVVASCYSLFTKDIADALGRKGLSVFIGWEGPVTLNHMDEAIKLLVDYVVKENLTWAGAVKKVNEELGPDPVYKEELKIITYSH